MGKKSGLLVRQQAYLEKRDREVRHLTKVYLLDMVTCALGRMGFREKRFTEFDKVLTEVCKDYAILISEDEKADKDLVYSKYCLDRELQQYVGSLFLPYDERYR